MNFDFNFTQDKLSDCISNNDLSIWYIALCDILPKYSINTKKRVAAWLAQTGHESGDFKFLVENLNYSTKGLRTVFPKYFPTDYIASQYARQPEKIANVVYANRLGNGNTISGDGWKFRGRGLIQVTGRSNYKDCSTMLYDSDLLLKSPELLQDVDGAIRSACWFWNKNNLNSLADAGDIVTISKRINGGTTGLQDRLNRYNNCLQVL